RGRINHLLGLDAVAGVSVDRAQPLSVGAVPRRRLHVAAVGWSPRGVFEMRGAASAHELRSLTLPVSGTGYSIELWNELGFDDMEQIEGMQLDNLEGRFVAT